jgi:hypothetical protein
LIVESSGPLVAVVVRPVALLPLVVIMPPVKVVVHSVADFFLRYCQNKPWGGRAYGSKIGHFGGCAMSFGGGYFSLGKKSH